MKIKTVKTQKISYPDSSITEILDKYLKTVHERSVVAITSKIVSICEGEVIKMDGVNKKELIKKEADYYIPAELNKYDMTLTVKNNVLIPTSGIDESNGNGYFILWPKDPQKSAKEIAKYLRKRFSLKEVGVIITDSKTTPLRRGTSGVSIGYSGFSALNNYIGKSDIFGKKMVFTKANIADALAASAVLVMGEGKEQTPIAIIEDVPFVRFNKNSPTKRELLDLNITLEDDIYAPILRSVKWKKK